MRSAFGHVASSSWTGLLSILGVATCPERAPIGTGVPSPFWPMKGEYAWVGGDVLGSPVGMVLSPCLGFQAEIRVARGMPSWGLQESSQTSCLLKAQGICVSPGVSMTQTKTWGCPKWGHGPI